jgi:hypothetical protein
MPLRHSGIINTREDFERNWKIARFGLSLLKPYMPPIWKYIRTGSDMNKLCATQSKNNLPSS